MEVSGSEESDQPLDDSDASSKSDDSWSLGSNESYLDDMKYSRKKLEILKNVFNIRLFYQFQF